MNQQEFNNHLSDLFKREHNHVKVVTEMVNGDNKVTILLYSAPTKEDLEAGKNVSKELLSTHYAELDSDIVKKNFDKWTNWVKDWAKKNAISLLNEKRSDFTSTEPIVEEQVTE